jgi:general secretion pathway protein C
LEQPVVSSTFQYQAYIPRIALVGAVALFVYSCFYAVSLLANAQAFPGNPVDQAGNNSGTNPAAVTRNENYTVIPRWHLFGNPPKKNTAVAKKPIKAPETKLKLDLLGIFFDKETKEGWVIIAEQGKPHKAYKVGDKLSGNTVIHSIEPDRVILDRNKKHESLSLKKLAPRNPLKKRQGKRGNQPP